MGMPKHPKSSARNPVSMLRLEDVLLIFKPICVFNLEINKQDGVWARSSNTLHKEVACHGQLPIKMDPAK